MDSKRIFRTPQIDKILRQNVLLELQTRFKREIIATQVRLIVADLKTNENAQPDYSAEQIADLVAKRLLELESAGVKKILNGTGVILSTNLGRAPLPQAALAELFHALTGYSNLEYSLAEGARGERTSEISALLGLLTGCQAAIVVNNCASAVMLAVKALSDQKEVIVSRGEMIEIGGSFRLPDVITSSGGRLKEIGTTNRTRAADYQKAIGSESGMLLKCHRSNYQVLGFTEETTVDEIAAIGKESGIPTVYDLGGGCLIDLSRFDITPDPTVQATLAGGIDLVLFSGDKLLGGPQAGIIAGKKELVEKLRKCPIYRALRADKLVIGLLEAVLKQYLYVDGHERLPVYCYAALSEESLRGRAEEILTALNQASLQHIKVEVCQLLSTMGGGSLPGQTLPSVGLAISAIDRDIDKVNRLLRGRPLALLGKVSGNQLFIDLRTIEPADDGEIIEALQDVDKRI
jgi:L-seryl-tRNA(Ser) seleniumtransferase